MNCPNENTKLEQVLFHDVEVDYCPHCLGMWFDEGELEMAKNDEDKNLNWLDVDLWRDSKKFEILKTPKMCPSCRTGLVQVHYDNSRVKVDFCKRCKGVWLDRGEFKQLINYLKRKSDYEILHHYTRDLAGKMWEVFTGPDNFRNELEDFFTLLKLFNYKFVAQYPLINSLIENSQK